MKGLLTAFTILSFVAASGLPMVASAQEMNKTDQTHDMGDQAAKPAMTTHSKSMHKSAHKSTHKKTTHRTTHRKHTAKAKHHKTTTMPPKEG